MRASNAFALPPDETPGMSRTNVAEERGPELKTRGRSWSVSGLIPSSWEPLSYFSAEAPTTSTCSVWPLIASPTSRRTSPFGATAMPLRV